MSRQPVHARIVRSNTSFEIEFRSYDVNNVRSIEIEPVKPVIDLDCAGDILGVEIINLVLCGGTNLIPIYQHEGVGRVNAEFSYDSDCDVANLRLEQGRSATQRSLPGSLIVDSNGSLVGIRLNLGEANLRKPLSGK